LRPALARGTIAAVEPTTGEQIVVQETTSSTLSSRPRTSVVRAAPGSFRLDQVAALKRTLVDVEGGLRAEVACRELTVFSGLASATGVTLVVLPA
jgi:hypothetical protein